MRTRLDLGLEPVDVLRRLRGRDRLVALIGDWQQGEALIACDPVHVLAPDDDPFAALDDTAGWCIGNWGYRLGTRIEDLPDLGPRPVPQPEFRVARYATVLRLVDGAWFVETVGDADPSALLDHLTSEGKPAEFEVGRFTLTPGPDGHRAGVQKALDHIRAGDIFQVNLCARLEASFVGDPLDLFCRGVEALAPAYAAFIDAPEGALASFSPELFLRRTGDDVLTSPIKGTAPLDPPLDEAGVPAGGTPTAVTELVASGKNRAENVMIVDLMRNDFGRVCTPGSVRVPAMVRPERHAVWHLVSDVVGHVGHDVPHSALLRATFPPGSVTGAPKVRAIEIAADLEPTSREAYTGAIGHTSPDGSLELNVAIRTFEISAHSTPENARRIWLGVGGGIVADSTPDGEFDELLVKAGPLVDAIGGTLDPDLKASSRVSDRGVRDAGVSRSPHLSREVDVSQGVFTTLLVLDGEPIDLEAHVARLDASVRAVYESTVRAGLAEAVRRKASGLTGRHRLRVDAAPGPSDRDVQVRLSTAELKRPATAWRLVPQIVPGGLGQHKWADRSVIGPSGPDYDPLLVDTDGSVLESGRANIFVVLDDGVHTPPLDGRILPGTARARIIEQLTAASIPVIQRRLTSDDFRRAAEVFVSNTLRGVVPVMSVDGMGEWPIGPLTQQLVGRVGPHGGGDSRVRGSIETPGDLDTPSLRAATRSPATRVLFIDNYDSFVYNLVQYVRELGASAEVIRNDARSVDEVVAARADDEFTHLVLSPGPGAPADAGMSVELIRRLAPTTPTLGVCLGHQAIGEAFGAAVVRAPEIVHGKPSLVHHDSAGVYAGLPSPLTCARYHSLVIDEATLPPGELVVTARTASGLVMGVRHTTHPVEGVQMHPESILTARGHDMLANFLR
jgi:para-aminobenzoate synthetase/4-amino-4-deoxychorismate lyase